MYTPLESLRILLKLLIGEKGPLLGGNVQGMEEVNANSEAKWKNVDVRERQGEASFHEMEK